MNRRKFFKFTAGAIALLAIPLVAAKRKSYTFQTGDWFRMDTPPPGKGRAMVTVYNKNNDIVDGPRLWDVSAPPHVTAEVNYQHDYER